MLSKRLGVCLPICVFAVFGAACSSSPSNNAAQNSKAATNSSADQGRASNRSTNSNENPDDAAGKSTEGNTTTGNAVAKAACMVTKIGGNRAVQISQTFAIDFEPFKGSCFVTSYNPEYGESHMETQYDIFTKGKKVFSFPGQFNGSKFGCWIDGVAFQDLNHDGLTDVVVVGKCAAKQTDYNENMVYINTGKAFTTREDSNNQLGDFKTIKEISKFVDENQQIFF